MELPAQCATLAPTPLSILIVSLYTAHRFFFRDLHPPLINCLSPLIHCPSSLIHCPAPLSLMVVVVVRAVMAAGQIHLDSGPQI